MVSPDDTSASEYVRRIVSYLNYSLVSHSISSEALRVVLTAYLNYAGNQSSAARRDSFSYGHYRHPSRQPDRSTDPNERMTLIVDSPDDLYNAPEGEVTVSPVTAPPPIERVEPPVAPVVWGQSRPERKAPVELVTDKSANFASEAAPLPAPPLAAPSPELDAARANPAANGFNQSPSVPLATELPTAAQFFRKAPRLAESKPAISQPVAQPIPQPAALAAAQPLVILNLDAKHLESPVELLATLPPHELLPELLARVLLGGIGRLYFEAYAQTGRVVWSQNGVLQSVLDQLPRALFQGVIRELQTMAHLSPVPVSQPQQAEIEYLYQQTCVLLRFRFTPGRHGEEATVQVLRGAALKFHQRQQLSKLKQDATLMAKQLQQKLTEIRMRAYSDPSLLEAKPEKLPKLLELLRNIEQQLEEVEEEGGS